jgi:hypothetical protein
LIEFAGMLGAVNFFGGKAAKKSVPTVAVKATARRR